MNELSTLPTSIRERLEQAQNLVSQDRGNEAHQLLRDATTELARTQPEFAAILVATILGQKEIRTEMIETVTSHVKVQYSLFGIPWGEEVVPQVSTREVVRVITIS